MASLLGKTAQRPWVWALLATLVMWAALGALSAQFSLASFGGVLASASFLALVALGQMLVIASGGGAIDLSIPGVITLAAFVTVSVTNGVDARAPLGLGLSLLAGALVGLVNAGVVLWLRVPPIIATLAVGYVLNTAALVYNKHFNTFAVSETLTYVASGRVLGVPLMALVVALLGVLLAALLNRTVYGRSLMAVGQNAVAAHLAGITVTRTVAWAYVLSGVLAALAGVLLSARVGGAFLELGTPYLLQSVGAVVVGGTAIAGGAATVLGTLFGSAFLVSAVTVMQVMRLSAGLQEIVQGVLIVLVLAVASGQEGGPRTARRRQRASTSSP